MKKLLALAAVLVVAIPTKGFADYAGDIKALGEACARGLQPNQIFYDTSEASQSNIRNMICSSTFEQTESGGGAEVLGVVDLSGKHKSTTRAEFCKDSNLKIATESKLRLQTLVVPLEARLAFMKCVHDGLAAPTHSTAILSLTSRLDRPDGSTLVLQQSFATYKYDVSVTAIRARHLECTNAAAIEPGKKAIPLFTPAKSIPQTGAYFDCFWKPNDTSRKDWVTVETSLGAYDVPVLRPADGACELWIQRLVESAPVEKCSSPIATHDWHNKKYPDSGCFPLGRWCSDLVTLSLDPVPGSTLSNPRLKCSSQGSSCQWNAPRGTTPELYRSNSPSHIEALTRIGSGPTAIQLCADESRPPVASPPVRINTYDLWLDRTFLVEVPAGASSSLRCNWLRSAPGELDIGDSFAVTPGDPSQQNVSLPNGFVLKLLNAAGGTSSTLYTYHFSKVPSL